MFHFSLTDFHNNLYTEHDYEVNKRMFQFFQGIWNVKYIISFIKSNNKKDKTALRMEAPSLFAGCYWDLGHNVKPQKALALRLSWSYISVR